MKISRPKFKVIELEQFVDFKFFCWLSCNGDQTEQEAFEVCKQLFDDSNADCDNPFNYIEECEDPGFPPRAGLKYCVRTTKKCTSYHYKPYECYCYQAGRWWKFKQDQHLFTEVHVPQIMSHYDFTKYKAPLKFLSAAAFKDWTYHLRDQDLRHIRRSMDKSMMKILDDE